jgi:hypothetical protein
MREVTGRVPLGEVLHDRSYEDPTPYEREDLSGKLEVSLTATPASGRPGDRIQVRLLFRNVSEAPIRLPFTAHSGPMMTLEVRGPEGYFDPPLPKESRPRLGPPYAIAVSLHPGAEIVHEAEWRAVIRELDLPEGVPPPPGGGPYRIVAPAPPGRYELRIQAMFHYEGFGLERPVAVVEIHP